MGNNNLNYETLTKWLSAIIVGIVGYSWQCVDNRLERLETDVAAIRIAVVSTERRSAENEAEGNRKPSSGALGVGFDGLFTGKKESK